MESAKSSGVSLRYEIKETFLGFKDFEEKRKAMRDYLVAVGYGCNPLSTNHFMVILGDGRRMSVELSGREVRAAPYYCEITGDEKLFKRFEEDFHIAIAKAGIK